MAKKKISKKQHKMRLARERMWQIAEQHGFFRICASDPGFLGRGLAKAAAQLTIKRARWLKIRNEQLAKAR